MLLWLCACINGVEVTYLDKWGGGYVRVAMVLWVCTGSNGVVVMYL